MFRILALVALLLVPLSLPASAVVTITFYSHKFQLMDGMRTDFPHGFVVMKGTTGDGTPVNVHLGFSAKNIFFDVLWRPVEGALDDEELTDAYVDDSIRHFSFPITDDQYRAVMAVEHKWRTWPQLPDASCIGEAAGELWPFGCCCAASCVSAEPADGSVRSVACSHAGADSVRMS